MRAILIATGNPVDSLPGHQPTPLLPLVDRPFLQHVVEYCVGQGARVFDWILCHRSAEIEQMLGQGQRWGATFRFHLVPSCSRPYGRAATLCLAEPRQEPILLGHADRLAAFQLAQLGPSARSQPVLFGARAPGDELEWRWSGWAVLPSQLVPHLCERDTSAAELEQRLRSCPGASWAEASQLLRMQSLEDVLTANQALLRESFPGLLLSGRSVEQDVRLARNVVLDPSATLVSPVVIGADCEIGAGARIGPNVVIGAGCVVDRQARIADAVVLPGTYVGESLALSGVLVDRDQVMADLAQSPDSLVLGNLMCNGLLRKTRRLLAQLMGLVLLLLAMPVLLLVAGILKLCRPGKVWHQTTVVRLPATRSAGRWKTFDLWSFCPHHGCRGAAHEERAGMHHFFLHFLPGLVNVVYGDLHLVGLPSRQPREVSRLGASWQQLYLQSKAGLVWETLLSSERPPEEEEYTLEGFYSVAWNPLADLALLGRYAMQVLTGWLTKPLSVSSPVRQPQVCLAAEGPRASSGNLTADADSSSERAKWHAAHPTLGSPRLLETPAAEPLPSPPALSGTGC